MQAIWKRCTGKPTDRLMLAKRLRMVFSRINLQWLALGSSVIFLLFLLPLETVLGSALPERVIGIEGAFLAGLILLPCLMGFILYLVSRKADDLERHMRKFENE